MIKPTMYWPNLSVFDLEIAILTQMAVARVAHAVTCKHMTCMKSRTFQLASKIFQLASKI